ncbi:MAG: DUF362 domain-containing protein [Candidatus Krumholzibacteria bacterium]|nr:DUF362 domain-containing protein [Candidatus Krumholzibacteria bacterium]
MLDRRKFLLGLAAGTAGLLVSKGKLPAFPLPKSDKTGGDEKTRSAEKHSMSVVKGADPALATRKAIELIGGMGSFVSRGDVVLVKPNIGWDRVIEQAADTNPAVVAALVAMALEAGAKKVFVADNPCNDPRRTYKRSGIMDAAKAAGAEVRYIEDRDYVKMNLGGEVLKDWLVYRDAVDADKIINVPIAKHHGLGGITLSMKNLMGITGGARNLMHQRLPESIVDLTAFFKPELTVLDAVRILKANGPQGGSTNDVAKLDTVAASADPVRIEAFGVTLFGKKSGDFPMISIGEKRGLGTSDFMGAGFVEVDIG